jgi:hypothetical protein
MAELAITPPLPSGGLNQPPEIQSVIVGTTANHLGDQIVAEATQVAAQTVTSAKLLALKGADVLLVAAPPAGYALMLENISLRLNFSTPAYTLNAGTLIVYLGPSANAVPLVADLSAILTATATSDNVGIPVLASGVITQVKAEAVGLYLGNTGSAQFTAGAGTLDVILTYTVVQM